ncbi:hypothetical protein FRB93_008933 [Tulasnella sp. JGI-2019a]|nr:hypothetical protein FRB93_008933 [Tulasnella sp. JGI-2019a]
MSHRDEDTNAPPNAGSGDFSSGGKDWLSIPNLWNHLLLLSAFRKTFLSLTGGVELESQPPKTRLSPPYTFLAKATYRFKRWNQTFPESHIGPLNRAELPPMDVLILFYTFMLSPWLYFEDIQLRFRALRSIGPFPLREVVSTACL